MLYTLKNGVYVLATVLDIERYLYYYNHLVAQQKESELVLDNFTYNELNVALYQHINGDYRKLSYVYQNCMHDTITVDKLQIAEKSLIELLKVVDTSEYFTTNYEKFYGEDMTEITYKCYFVAISILVSERDNITLENAMSKMALHLERIYDEYMQAECVEAVAYE